jgi:hypothetical protein
VVADHVRLVAGPTAAVESNGMHGGLIDDLDLLAHALGTFEAICVRHGAP